MKPPYWGYYSFSTPQTCLIYRVCVFYFIEYELNASGYFFLLKPYGVIKTLILQTEPFNKRLTSTCLAVDIRILLVIRPYAVNTKQPSQEVDIYKMKQAVALNQPFGCGIPSNILKYVFKGSNW